MEQTKWQFTINFVSNVAIVSYVTSNIVGDISFVNDVIIVSDVR